MKLKFRKLYPIIAILAFLITIASCACSVSDGYVYYNCNGNMLPCTGSYNLGSPTAYWDTIYVNNIVGVPIGVGNVTTSGGTAGTIAKFTAATNIENSSVTEAQVSGAVASSHTQNTDSILTTNGVTQLINAGLLKNDLETDRWLNEDSNTFLGVDVAGNDSLAHTAGVEGYGNTAIGYKALYDISTSYYNTAIGYHALTNLTSGIYNTAVGQGTLANLITGQFNTAIGMQALNSNTGSGNTALGLFAGSNNTGDNNVFIGKQAGEDEAGSNKLYIDNSDDATPLIYGDFSTDKVTINEDLDVADDLSVVGTAHIGSLPAYANNAAALGGGLIAGDLYRTGGDPDLVCVVH